MIVKSKRVLLPEGLKPAALVLKNGKIDKITAWDAKQDPSLRVLDAGTDLVTPGIVDSHVHINEPGRTEWEGFRTATEAAAAGGITTVVDMPLNCIPATTSQKNAELKQEHLRDLLHVDVAFWGGVIPGNHKELKGLAKFGVPGAKCFTCPSGVDEFPHVTAKDLDVAMPILRDLGITLLVHAEAPEPLEEAEAHLHGADPKAYSTYLASRPRAAEDEAIAMIIALSKKHRCPAHIVHLSSSSALPMLEKAQAEGVPITAETCLHYLTFTAEEIQAGATQFKCAPPIREKANREALWEGLSRGTISMVVSDHSPCTPQLKKPETGDFMSAWGGIAGLQLGLSALWTEAKARGFSIDQVSQWHSRAPARLAGLEKKKGKIAKGFDADLVIWNDEASFKVGSEDLRHKHKVSPYTGRTLSGVVKHTILGGRVAFSQSNGLFKPQGQFLSVKR